MPPVLDKPPRDDSRDCNFVLGDNEGHQIDVHSFELDSSGNNIFGVAYRAEHLTGKGTIEGHSVYCISPAWMVKFHTGYPLDENDFLDVKELCEKFGIEMPEEHKTFWCSPIDNKASNLFIRGEIENDYEAIYEIHQLVFGSSAEAKLVNNLRQNGDAVISLVAEKNGRIVGHVLFSKLKAPMRSCSLAPVGVHPSFQRQGIGSALIREGLKQVKEKGWRFVFVFGDPAYYQHFGFNIDAAKGYTSPYSGDHFMVLSFGDVPQTGQIIYPEPFKLLD
jgi:putative acetyltransferase